MFSSFRHLLSHIGLTGSMPSTEDAALPDCDILKLTQTTTSRQILQGTPSGLSWLENTERDQTLRRIFEEGLGGRVLVDLRSSDRWYPIRFFGERSSMIGCLSAVERRPRTMG